jgi:cytochrome b561
VLFSEEQTPQDVYCDKFQTIIGQDIMTPPSNSGFSLLQIALHWVIAILVLFQLFYGESMTSVVDAAAEGTVPSPTDVSLSVAHYWVGVAILCLVIVRLLVRIFNGAPAPADASTWMGYVATAVHWLFYALLVAVPVTGLLTVYVSDAFGDIHSLGKPIFIVLILAHACGALFHQFVIKDGTLRRMLVPAK